MKKLFYGSLVLLLLSLLILLPAYFLFVVGDSASSLEQVKLNCLNSGGTSVEYQGKFERCIPR